MVRRRSSPIGCDTQAVIRLYLETRMKLSVPTESQRATHQGGHYGNANANSALPAPTATYCFPSTANDIGEEYTDAPHWKCHRLFPDAASNAMKFPSASPLNTS